MRPKLPPSIENLFPEDVLSHIYSYVPHTPKKKPKHSPSLQKELHKIQNVHLSGKSGMYMRDLLEFCLD